MNSAPRVLIVDRSLEAREVLRTLLELRGATTIEVREPRDGVLVAGSSRFDLIVCDAESDTSVERCDTTDLAAAARRSDTPIVILGTIAANSRGKSAGEFMAKPYHYGPLIRKIEELLAAA